MKLNVYPKLSRTQMVWFCRCAKSIQTPEHDNNVLRGLENRGLVVSWVWKDLSGADRRSYKLSELGLVKFAAAGSIREVV